MLPLKRISEILKDRKLGVIAEKTGLHVNTITGIRDGTITNPHLKTIEALSSYLENSIKYQSRPEIIIDKRK